VLAVKDGERTFSFKVTIFEAFIHGFDEVIQPTDKLWNAESPLAGFCHYASRDPLTPLDTLENGSFELFREACVKHLGFRLFAL
jgi:hypothetical protein